MERDEIYARRGAVQGDGPFEFSDAVARVFPDMLRRSIPGYAASLQAIETLARRHVRERSQCYDLGCSLGAATLAMCRGIEVPGCKVFAIDNAPAMIARCRENLHRKAPDVSVRLLCADVRDAAIADASMVVMNYTLQFLPPPDRQTLIDRIAAGMRPGGMFVLSEKVTHIDPQIDQTLVELHHDFKRRHAYSELEISRKRAALENVLVPDTVEQHEERLKSAGFSHVGLWLRYFNFVSMVAIRQ